MAGCHDGVWGVRVPLDCQRVLICAFDEQRAATKWRHRKLSKSDETQKYGRTIVRETCRGEANNNRAGGLPHSNATSYVGVARTSGVSAHERQRRPASTIVTN